MNRPTYNNLISSEDIQTFYFDSIGRHGTIRKAIMYTLVDKSTETYNLGFGTLKKDSDGEWYIDGKDKTNNGDINRVLSTVAKTIEVYLSKFPERSIYFTGYTDSLTKLYQRIITNDFKIINQRYDVFGNLEADIEYYNFEFYNPAKEYFGFLIKIKPAFYH